jgi:hypothetical protein
MPGMVMKRLSAVGVVLVPLLINVLANAFYDVLRANVGAVAEVLRSTWFPFVLFMVLAAIWLFWVFGPLSKTKNAKPRPETSAQAEGATGTGSASESTVRFTDSLSHLVIPGPGNPTLHQVGYQTEGRRHYAHGAFKQRPKAIRFSKPEDRLLRSTDLPFEMSCGSGQIVVEKFYADGVVIDEVGTIGDPVAFVAYFEDE